MTGVAIAWTGGKDSSLAFYEAERLGFKIDSLVTFAWSHEPFVAHPLDFILLQAQALEIPHYKLDVSEPFERGYEDALTLLKQEHGVGILITGDIGEVAGHDPNWFVDRAVHSNIEVIRPLWHNNRVELLNRLLELRFRVVFSCVKKPWFTDEWLGKPITAGVIQRLVELNRETGLDICGEQGEYHTLATNGPQFKKRIRIQSYSKHEHDSVMYIALESMRLEDENTIHKGN
jgi:uncharacterized protein (TIGR00290 family)